MSNRSDLKPNPFHVLRGMEVEQEKAWAEEVQKINRVALRLRAATFLKSQGIDPDPELVDAFYAQVIQPSIDFGRSIRLSNMNGAIPGVEYPPPPKSIIGRRPTFIGYSNKVAATAYLLHFVTPHEPTSKLTKARPTTPRGCRNKSPREARSLLISEVRSYQKTVERVNQEIDQNRWTQAITHIREADRRLELVAMAVVWWLVKMLRDTGRVNPDR